MYAESGKVGAPLNLYKKFNRTLYLNSKSSQFAMQFMHVFTGLGYISVMV